MIRYRRDRRAFVAAEALLALVLAGFLALALLRAVAPLRHGSAAAAIDPAERELELLRRRALPVLAAAARHDLGFPEPGVWTLRAIDATGTTRGELRAEPARLRWTPATGTVLEATLRSPLAPPFHPDAPDGALVVSWPAAGRAPLPDVLLARR